MELVQLAHPVNSDGLTTDTLHMRRPVVADMLLSEKLKGSDAQKEVTLFANLCEVAPSVIEALDMTDYIKCKTNNMIFCQPQLRHASVPCFSATPPD